MSNQYGNMSVVSARNGTLVFCVDAAMIPSATPHIAIVAMKDKNPLRRSARVYRQPSKNSTRVNMAYNYTDFPTAYWTK